MLSSNQTTTTQETSQLIIPNDINVTAHMVDTNEDFNPFLSMQQLSEWFMIQSLITNNIKH